MAKPRIGYASMLTATTTTVTASSTEAGFDVADIYDYKSYTLWKAGATTNPAHIDIDTGTSAAADYIGLVNHNMDAIAATVTVYADTFTPPTTSRLAFTPTGEYVSMRSFTSPGALRYWRVTFSKGGGAFAAKPYVGTLLLGLVTQLPEYFGPSVDPFLKDAEVQGARSEGGHYLAGLVRGETHRGTLSFGAAGLARSFFTSDMNAFLNHARLRKPWLLVVDADDSDFSAARYLKLTDGSRIQRSAVGGTWARLDVSLEVEEAFMEPLSI